MSTGLQIKQGHFDDDGPSGTIVQTSFLRSDQERIEERIAAAPARGVSLEMRTARRGQPIRDAVAALVEGAVVSPDERAFHAAFSPRWSAITSPVVQTRLATRIAWNLVGSWLLADVMANCSGRISLVDAEQWFCGNVRISSRPFCEMFSAEALWQAEQSLRTVAADDELLQLLPHIFEEHGQGSRASVMRDPSTAPARRAKRRAGVFYTPADVAEYMVREALSDQALAHAQCLDPACGTGVFLLALLHRARAAEGRGFDSFEYATRCLHGMDISAQALDACAFLLLLECWSSARGQGFSPWTAWHRLRLNLVQVDAVTVAPANPNLAQAVEFQRVVAALKSGGFVEPIDERPLWKDESAGLFGTAAVSISAVFPEAVTGFDCIIGNPPYAAISEDTDLRQLACEFRSLPESHATARTNLFPLFIEMMWKFAHPGDSRAALVTPLSIAYHTGTQFENCRRAMSAAGGRWRFAFFDREPHALFGEEVKTRNAILFHRRSTDLPAVRELAQIETGPLRKWTSRTRAQLFGSIDFTPVGQSSITFGIPKLRGVSQATAFLMLQKCHERLPSLTGRICKVRPFDTLGQSLIPRVFVGGTAYNFINVYRSAELPDEAQIFPMSESPVHCLEFRCETDAEASLAILSSRIVFWLWHVLGDGFHVSSRLFDAVPFSRRSFSPDVFDELATLGRQLWHRLRDHRYTSLNGGRTTIGYRPFRCGVELHKIDALLGEAVGLSDAFLSELRTFVQSNALVDEADETRRHLRQHFTDDTPT
jgi:hypothetical protein